MRRHMIEQMLKEHETLEPLVNNYVRGYAVGYAKSWCSNAWNIMAPRIVDQGTLVSDELIDHWRLYWSINGESLSIDVYGYPYIDDDNYVDISLYTLIHREPIPFTQNKTLQTLQTLGTE